MKNIEIPDPCLVLMVGPDCHARSRIAGDLFDPDEIVLAETDETSSFGAAARRLSNRLLTVVNARNLTFEDRLRWYGLAKERHMTCVAIVVASPLTDTPEAKDLVKRAVRSLKSGEGVLSHVLIELPLREDVRLIRLPLPVDKRDDRGPFDIIGDVHGCAEELQVLLESMGWVVTWLGSGIDKRPELFHPERRKLVFLGDIVDRGPRSRDALLLVEATLKSGAGYAVMGNHDKRLLQWLHGRRVDDRFGLAATIREFEGVPAAEKMRFAELLNALPSHLVFDGGQLIVAHAGLADGMALGMSAKVARFAIFGPMQTNDEGENERVDWAGEYSGRSTVVYGHLAQRTAVWRNQTICIDTSCVFGGELTALRWPELDLVAVPANRVYHPRERDTEDLPLIGNAMSGA